MTVCKFYASGYCRYGNSCRFEHIDNTRNYYQKTYHRNDGPQSQPSIAPKVGFSFKGALETISNSNRGPVQSSSLFGGSPAFRSNEPQMSSFNRTYQVSKPVSSHPTHGSSGGFSFNRTLQQISTTYDIEMDANSTVPQKVQFSMSSREPHSHPLNLSSQTNIGLFGNKQTVFPKTVQNSSISSSANVSKVNDVYSNASDLTENEIKSFKANTFTYKSIPVRPPPQELCI